MKRQELFEDEVTDAMIDYFNGGEEPPLTIDQLAPEADGMITDDIEYYPSEDPELNPRVTQAESTSARRFNRLTEKNAEQVAAYLASTKSPSYEDFLDSEYVIKDPTVDKYRRVLNNLAKEGNEAAAKALGGKSSGGSNIVGKSADNGVYTRNPTGNISKQLSAFMSASEGGNFEYTADDMFNRMEGMIDSLMDNSASTPHLLIAGDPGVGKTYTIMKAIEKYAPNKKMADGRKITYLSGSLGSNFTTLVPFFYVHRAREIIILDDVDDMIMSSAGQDIQNFMKSVLDPKADNEKPIHVKDNMRTKFATMTQQMLGDNLVEGHHIRIDTDAILNEKRFDVYIDDNLVGSQDLTLMEAQSILEHIKMPRLTESEYDDDDDDYEEIETENSESQDNTPDGKPFFPSEFNFSSQVIFISNLVLSQISPAVADRCAQIEIILTAQQFMDRLAGIYPSLAEARSQSTNTISAQIRIKIKKAVFECMDLVVQAYNEGIPLLKKPVEINNKLTFRKFTTYFDEFMNCYKQAAQGKLVDIFDPAKNMIPAGEATQTAYFNQVANKVSAHVIRTIITDLAKVGRK